MRVVRSNPKEAAEGHTEKSWPRAMSASMALQQEGLGVLPPKAMHTSLVWSAVWGHADCLRVVESWLNPSPAAAFWRAGPTPFLGSSVELAPRPSLAAALRKEG